MLMWRKEKGASPHGSVWTCHVAHVYRHATWHTRMDMPHGARVCVCARVYARVCACAHMWASVITEIKHPCHNNAIPLNTYTLYTRQISLIYIMRDYLFILIWAGDVASCGARDHAI